MEYDFNRLQNVYIATLHSYDKALAFDLEVGSGRFLFMMYLSEEDKESRDMLFIYMRNTRVMRRLKMYGNHIKGKFSVYINDELKTCFIQELQIKHTNGEFNFIRFLNQLNEAIPLEVSQESKIRTLRDNKNIIETINVIDEADKTVFIGDKKLSVGSPQDKTLRKLYIYTDANVEDVTALIKILKKMNRTVAWTTENSRYKIADIRDLINCLSQEEKV